MTYGCFAWALALCAVAMPATAQEIAIYRCTDAQGALTVQNQPCPKGMQQHKRMMQTPAPVAAPAPLAVVAPAPVAPVPADPDVSTMTRPPDAPAPSPVEKPAPPPLYSCRRRDQTRYLAETLKDTEYCVPMQVVGLDGNPATGGGDACEVIRDTCEPVPDATLCESWQQLQREAEDHWRFATPDHATERQRAFARLRELVAGSRCGDGAGEPAQKP